MSSVFQVRGLQANTCAGCSLQPRGGLAECMQHWTPTFQASCGQFWAHVTLYAPRFFGSISSRFSLQPHRTIADICEPSSLACTAPCTIAAHCQSLEPSLVARFTQVYCWYWCSVGQQSQRSIQLKLWYGNYVVFQPWPRRVIDDPTVARCCHFLGNGLAHENELPPWASYAYSTCYQSSPIAIGNIQRLLSRY